MLNISSLVALIALSAPTFAYTLAPPPVKGSRKHVQDFKTLKKYHDARTPATCAEAGRLSGAGLAELYGPETGILTAEQITAVEGIETFYDLQSEASEAVSELKEQFKRPRPFVTDKNLKPCFGTGGYAYPSFHAASAAVTAEALAYLFPRKKAKILRAGELSAWSRVIAGVHHPSDVRASQDLARQIVKKWIKEKKLKRL
jgi:acid phosphatase (class A)